MVIKQIVSILLLGHLLGDYYWQTPAMASRKEKDYKAVLWHCLCYTLANLALILPFANSGLYIWSILSSGLHWLVDSGKYFLQKTWAKQKGMTVPSERHLFFADQGLHIVSILFIAYLAASKIDHLAVHGFIHQLFESFGLAKYGLTKAILVLAFIGKPANIMIQKTITIYKPKSSEIKDLANPKAKVGEKDEGIKNTGRLIGIIERIIMLIFIGLNQYGAIGLVLTAKSIARYDKISKDQKFAEYYLLGTLLSTLIVISLGLFINWL